MNAKLLALGRLEQIIEALRGPNGCPWDKAQTLGSLSRFFVEESCEVIDAIDDSHGQPSPGVCEELGDVLVNVLLSSHVAEQGGGFDLAEVAKTASDKLVRRHPHVFGSATASSVDEVLKTWNQIKAEEKRALNESAGTPATKPSRLDGVPRSLPALERAHDIGVKAARAGFDWPDVAGALLKVEEELAEVKSSLGNDADLIEDELGDLLFSVVNVCRKLSVRPEVALRRATQKFQQRFHRLEERIPHLEEASLENMEAVWQEAKISSAKAAGKDKESRK